MVGKAERPADHRQFPLDVAPRWEWGGRIVGQVASFGMFGGPVGWGVASQPRRPVGWFSQHREGDGMRSGPPRNPSCIGIVRGSPVGGRNLGLTWRR
jgi:hypothetical protein